MPQKNKLHALLVLVALGAAAMEPTQAACTRNCAERITVKELVKRLQERDAAIADLQGRVRTLELQKIGAASPAAPANQSKAAPAAETTTAQAPTRPSADAAPEVPSPSTTSQTKPTSPARGEQEAPPPESARTARTAAGELEVDEQAAERALERTLVTTGAALLPQGLAEIQPGFTYVRNESDARTFFRADSQDVTVYEKLKSDRFIGDLLLRLGLPFDSQLDVGLPYEHQRVETVTQVNLTQPASASVDNTGFGDLRVGLSKILLRAKGWWPDVVGRVAWDTNTGDKSITGGFHELGGGITLAKKQDPLVFIGSVTYGTTLEKDDVRPGNALGFTVGAILAASPETSLRAVLSQSFIGKTKVRGIRLGGTDRVSGVMSFGASTILGRGLFLDLAAGIGLTEDAPDYSIGLTFSKRFDFPPRF